MAGTKDFEVGRRRWRVVTAGTAAGLLGAALGGVVHRWLGEQRALLTAGLVQAFACAPLIAASEP